MQAKRLMTFLVIGILLFSASALLYIGTSLAAGDGYQRDLLRVGVVNLPPRLDPHAEASLTGSRIWYNVFDTLIRMDPENNSILEPGLAVSWERVADNVLELKLRPNVFFHNGEPFTSADVKFSFERLLHGSSEYSTFSTARSLVAVVERVEVVDPLTVRVITYEPDPVLEYRLASLWGSWIVPEGYLTDVGNEAFSRNPVGTGPFKVVSFRAHEVVLEAFPDYWGDQPNVRQVVYREIPEAAARVTALINGEVDIINPVEPDFIPMLARHDHIEVQSREHQLIHLLVYYAPNPIMQDKNLRRAMNLAIDREAIAAALWPNGAAGVPRGHQFPDYGEMYDSDRPVPEYNPAKARELLAASNYNGETIYYDLIPNYYENDVAAAEIIIEMWREIGINAEIRFTAQFWQNEDRAVHPWSYALRFADPVGGLWLLWGEHSSKQAHGNNDWSDVPPRFNELGNELAFTMDPELRKSIFINMLDMYEDEAPGTTLWRPAITSAMHRDINWNVYNTLTMDFGAGNLSFND